MPVARAHRGAALIGNIVFTYHQVLRTNGNLVLIVTLIFIKRVILIDIFHIGHASRRLIHSIACLLRRQGITLSAVVVLVALKDIEPTLIVVVAAIEMIIITCGVVERRERVFLHSRYSFGSKLLAQFFEEFRVGGVGELG